MSDNEYDKLKLVGRHVPADNSGPFNSMAEALARGHDTLNPTTGVYQVGFLRDGDFVPFYEDAAAHVFEQLANAKKAREAKEQAEPKS